MFVVLVCFAQAAEIIIDDQDGAPHFTTTGDDWTTWSTLNYGFDAGDTEYHYTSHTVGGSDRRGTATWHPDIPVAGTWEVQTWFRKTENRTADADFIVTDGHGATSKTVLDQRGEGASGWVTLDTVWCAAGFDGCFVTLDANDDDHSDEANAVRFVLIEEDSDPDPDPEPETTDCDAFPGLGQHTLTWFAADVDSDGWTSPGKARGEPDGETAHSENVDAGEGLRASGFAVCDPPGEETIDRVVVSVKGQTQYDSGAYEVRLRLDAGGAHAVWNGAQMGWHSVDVTADQAWTWASLSALQAQVGLHDHPGGHRDSDAWVDAFRLQVHFTSTAGPDDGTDPQDTGPVDQPQDSDPAVLDSAVDSGAWSRPPGSRLPMDSGCSAAPGVGFLLFFGLFATSTRRRR